MWILILFFGMSILSVIAYKYFPVYLTPLMVIRCCEQIKNGEKLKLKHEWKDLEDISNHMPIAALSAEDYRFIYHNGFSKAGIKRALEHNNGKHSSIGGSTISQQTAKNVFLWPNKNWFRKGLEAYYTILIETFWDKHRIMEVYLNSIEMGNGIYGVEAAAREHFGCSAKDLTRQQSALIAASLPNPRECNITSPNKHLLNYQKIILNKMTKNANQFPSEEEIKVIRKKDMDDRDNDEYRSDILSRILRWN